jgi:serine protease Do
VALTSRRQCLGALGGFTALAAAGWARADLANVVAAVRGSIVPVGSYNATDNPRFGFRGTGFVVGDGSFVATNHHVLPATAEVESVSRLAVLVGDPANGTPTVRRATVHATDRDHDLALLKVEGPALPAMNLAEGGVREGQSIALMGYPIGGTFGFSPVTHRGIVASITRVALPAATAQQLDPRAVSRLRAGNFEVLQLDATAYPGNSGGPVFDIETGSVVGVLNMVLVRSSRESALTNPTGISYAIPVRHLQALLQAR